MTAIIITAGIVALVWGTLLAVRGSLIAGCLTFLVLASCFGVHFLHFDMAGITLSIDRLFLVGLVGAYVVQWRLGRTQPKPLTIVDLTVFALIGVLLASTFTHDWRTSGPNQVPIIQHLINGYLIPLVLYWIARQATLDERGVTMILVTLTCFGVYLAVTGLLEVSQQWSLVFPHYIANPDIGLHFGRARGPMVQSVSYGLYLGTCLLCAWLWRERLARHWQLAVLLALPLFVAAVYFTKTRSVWLGAATGLMVVLMLTLKGRVRVAVLGTMIAAGLVVGLVKLDAIMGLQREGTVEDTRRSASMRASFAYVSWQMFCDRPLTGFGFGQFAQAKLPYLSDRSVDLQLEEIRAYVHHNTFLSLLTETGLIGLGLLIAVLGGWAKSGWSLVRGSRAPPWMRRHGLLMLGMLGVALWQMAGHEITFTPLDNSLIFFMAGVAVGLRAMMRAGEVGNHVRSAVGEFGIPLTHNESYPLSPTHA
jgi:O-antigen ligase